MVQTTGVVVVAGGHGVIHPGTSKLVETLDSQGRLPMIVQVLCLAHESAAAPPVLVVNSRFRDQILRVLDEHGLRGGITVVPQGERRGAAHAIFCALSAFEARLCDAFLVLYGDMPAWRPATLRALVSLHRKRRPAISMVSVPIRGVQTPRTLERFGRILRGPDGQIVGVVEPGEATNEQLEYATGVNPSLFVFDTAWFAGHYQRIPLYPRRDGHPDEYHVPPLVAMAAAEGAPIAEMPLQDPFEALGVNTREDLDLVREVIARRAITSASTACAPHAVS